MIFCFKPVKHVLGEVAPSRLRIANAALNDRIQRDELHFAILNELYAFAQNLAFRAIATRLDQLRDVGLKLLPKICIDHSHTPAYSRDQTVQ